MALLSIHCLSTRACKASAMIMDKQGIRKLLTAERQKRVRKASKGIILALADISDDFGPHVLFLLFVMAARLI